MANKGKELVKDRALLQKTIKMGDLLIASSEDEKLKEAVLKLKFVLSNCSPSASKSIFEMDNKIYNKIEDLQIDIVKNKENMSDTIVNKIENIKILIAKRNFTDGVN